MAEVGHNTNNYTEQGGSRTVIGGELNLSGIVTQNDGTQANAIAVPTDLASCITAVTAIISVLKKTGLTK